MKLILRALLVLLAVHNAFADEVSIDRQTILELRKLIASPSRVDQEIHSELGNIHSLFLIHFLMKERLQKLSRG